MGLRSPGIDQVDVQGIACSEAMPGLTAGVNENIRQLHL
jgi:hypothetical protein